MCMCKKTLYAPRGADTYIHTDEPGAPASGRRLFGGGAQTIIVAITTLTTIITITFVSITLLLLH